ncbi:UbiD family decarboxylase [Sphingomonas canadensis]|uniref:UbiD family decarboxylase n=1 Tax=Sphingomonas canadensis TaxID=1219257 RepID=A0ABW3H9Z3_9SPHN|nr:UbiD family decarboxylase [Sphingomonas canadensis]MCW3836196.1 UbiD family decarboxylase [Sphingomonas canadensis]
MRPQNISSTLARILGGAEPGERVDRVARQVDPTHEIAAVIKAAQLAGSHPILFEQVAGSDIPVISNIYSDHDRLRRFIGAAGNEGFCQKWLDIVATADDRDCTVSGKRPDAGWQSCRLSDLPRITYHERDGGPYLTTAIFLAKEPDTSVPNLSFHRSMMVGDDELRVRLGSSHDLARYQRKAEERGEALEAALLIGVKPSLFMAACASLPYDRSELAIAARIDGAPVEMRRCVSIDLEVPVDAEIVVEGRFLPNIRRPEGPFGEFLGNYVEVGDNHVFEVTHVSRRPDAVFHALLCGSDEDLRPLEATTAARVYGHLRNVMSGVLDVSCHPTTMMTIIRLRTEYEGHGKHALLAALGSNLDYNKVVIAVDEDVDIHDMDDVMWAYLTRGRADTRAMVLSDVPGFYRDPQKDHWGRLAIDATMPWGRQAEFQRKQIPGLAGLKLSDYLDA